MMRDYNQLCSDISSCAWKIRDLVEDLDRDVNADGIAYSQAQIDAKRAKAKAVAADIAACVNELFHPVEDKQTVTEIQDGQPVQVEKIIPLTSKQVILKTLGEEMDKVV